MKKITTMLTFAATILLFCSFSTIDKRDGVSITTPISEDIDGIQERQMLADIEYLEEDEEINLGFDSYFLLPTKFNAYKGMEFSLDEIEYLELHE